MHGPLRSKHKLLSFPSPRKKPLTLPDPYDDGDDASTTNVHARSKRSYIVGNPGTHKWPGGIAPIEIAQNVLDYDVGGTLPQGIGEST